MKKTTGNLCPGCKRHCPAGHARCKYGQKYFEKHHPSTQTEPPAKERRHAWEKHVTPGGLFWQLLWQSRRIKRALRKEKVSEQQLLLALSVQEQEQLRVLLDKISKTLA